MTPAHLQHPVHGDAFTRFPAPRLHAPPERPQVHGGRHPHVEAHAERGRHHVELHPALQTSCVLRVYVYL